MGARLEDRPGDARHRQEARTTIEPFLRLDRVSAFGGLFVVLVAWAFGLRRDGLLLVVAASVVGLIALLTAALRALDADAVVRALALATIGNWVVAVVVASTVPQLWPVMIMVTLMPVVLASPFLGKRPLVVLLSAAAATVSVVSAAGLLNDDGGVVPDLEDEFELLLVIGAGVALTVPIALIAHNTNRLLQDRLQSLEALNVELEASRRELAASRSRVVVASDAARRQIERDLHDGAQQRLVALGVRLRLLESIIGPDHDLHDDLRRLVNEADGAVEELRMLAHGIYPPLLETSGIGPALQVAARRSGPGVGADVAVGQRLETGHERALYFVALEALTNAAKYAPGSAVTLRLTEEDGVSVLTVRDDGPGFDVGTVGPGNGTHNMRDRMAAVGGELRIESVPGGGTTVVARLPHSSTR